MPDFEPYDPRQAAHNAGSTLPRWRQEQAIYFVTFRLADSLPAQVIREWDLARRSWLICNLGPELIHDLEFDPTDPFSVRVKVALQHLNEETARLYHQRFTTQWHDFLDAGYGDCVLSSTIARTIVEECLTHFDGTRYQLFSSVIMPNHVHALVQPQSEDLSVTCKAWKSVSCRRINEVLGRSGSLWMRESFNRIVRTGENYKTYRQYIIDNPAKGKLSADQYTLIHDD
jgi:REP element-mobilizing transposase RayT